MMEASVKAKGWFTPLRRLRPSNQNDTNDKDTGTTLTRDCFTQN